MNLDADPYRTLGLTRGASLDEVKRAYRRLAKANHPDAAGAAALPRFLAIHAAYEQIVGGSASPAGPQATSRRRPSSADAERADATRRAYGGRPRAPRAGTGPDPARAQSQGSTTGSSGTRPGAARPGRKRGDPAGRTGQGAAGAPGAPGAARASGASDAPPGGTTEANPARGKATLGSTSYDGADAGPFEPDWGGASWYGTTSGTYWTINPKEYADPRKHGPEYQARARRAAATPGAAADPAGAGAQPEAAAHGAAATPGAAGPDDATGEQRPNSGRGPAGRGPAGRARPGRGPASPTHTTSSWWDSTSGAEPEDEPRQSGRPRPANADAFEADRPYENARSFDADDPAPDPARAALDLARALTDPRSGGLRGRAVRAVLGWLPIAFGLGWLVGELTGCVRFAATCDPSVAPLTYAGQAIVLVGLLLVPEIAALAAGAALVLLAAATAATLIISATGTAADEGSRRAALGALLVIAWLSGLAIAIVRRVHSGVRPARPVS
jgi:hypothetical protein